jgi:hypothetical protein
MRSRRRKVEGILASFVDPRANRVVSAKRAKSATDVELAMATADVAARTGDWDDVSPRTFVGLYAWCHNATYKVEAAELREKHEFMSATRAAARLLRDEFEDDGGSFAIYIRWAWKREQERVAWAARERIERGRLGWRLLFSTRFVTDYRVAVVASKGVK